MDSALFRITLQGRPVSKKRPRFLKTGRTYDSQSYEKKEVEREISQKWSAKRPIFFPLTARIKFYMPCPKSWTKARKKNYKNEFHIVKPDIDNLAKFYLDCMNEIVFHDDKQIVEMITSKQYCDHEGATVIEIRKAYV